MKVSFIDFYPRNLNELDQLKPGIQNQMTPSHLASCKHHKHPGKKGFLGKAKRRSMIKAKRKNGAPKPFFLVYTDHGWNQEEMAYRIWKMKPGEDRDELRAKYDYIFGEDPNCLGWCPQGDLSDYRDMIAHRSAPDEKCDLRRNIRAHLLVSLLDFIQTIILDNYAFGAAMKRLYEPTREFHGMENVAYFRQEVVWPMFGSTEAFYNFILKFKEDLQQFFFRFRVDEHIPMTAKKLPKYFKELGDADGQLLAKLHLRLFQDYKENIYVSFNQLCSDIQNYG